MIKKNWLVAIFVQVLLAISCVAQPKSIPSIPEIKRVQFKSQISKTIPGLISERELASGIKDEENLDNLAIPISVGATSAQR